MQKKRSLDFLEMFVTICNCFKNSPRVLYLDTGVTGGHGLDIERRPHNIPVSPEAGLGGPRPIPLPGVGPHTELVLGVVIQISEHSLLVSCLAELLLIGTGAFPKLYLILGHLNSIL